jgi:histidinol dehydrogenase
MPAGPSELLIVADDTAVPASIRFIIASRTWSNSQVILVSTKKLIDLLKR